MTINNPFLFHLEHLNLNDSKVIDSVFLGMRRY